MKVAHIIPPVVGDAALSRRGYHMALAQYLGQYPTYMNLFKSLGFQGHFIMVDNGAAEGTRLEWGDIAALANLIHADEVVVPDVLKDGEETLKLASKVQAEGLIAACRRIVVPQGKTWDEWEECLFKLTMVCDFVTIGVAKHLESLEGGREKALMYLTTNDFSYFNVHLLGCYGNPLHEIKTLKKFSMVRGIDTGAAAAYAQASVMLDPDSDRDVPRHSLDWASHFDSEILTFNMISLERAANGM